MSNAIVPVKPNHALVPNFGINTNDVITVATAKAERKIRDTVAEIMSQIKELEAKVQEAKDELDIIPYQVAERVYKKAIKSMTKALIDAGAKKDGEEQIVSAWGSVHRIHGKEDTILCKLAIHSRDCGVCKQEAVPQRYKDLSEFILNKEKQIGAMREKGVEWKRKLSNVSSIERAMRAKVVEMELEKTGEGQAMLDAMMKNFDDAVEHSM